MKTDGKNTQTFRCPDRMDGMRVSEWVPMLYFAIDEYNGHFVMDQFQPMSLLHPNNTHRQTSSHSHSHLRKYFRVVRSAKHSRSCFFLKTTKQKKNEEDLNGTTWSDHPHIQFYVLPVYTTLLGPVYLLDFFLVLKVLNHLGKKHCIHTLAQRLTHPSKKKNTHTHLHQ